MRWCGIPVIALLFQAMVILDAGPVHAGGPMPAAKTGHYAINLQYAGGEGVGYVLEQIRWGDHRSFERVVFEFSPPDDGGWETLPRIKLETEFYPLRMAIRMPGSDRRQEEIFPSADPFGRSTLIARVESIDVCGGGQHLVIVPARPVEGDVFTLTSPPRLIVDLIPNRMGPLPEGRRLSLRTLPLHGDQVCLFLENAADEGVTPRLLKDRAGNVFGELGLHEDPGEALASLRSLRSRIGDNFTLAVQARGVMEVPEVLP